MRQREGKDGGGKGPLISEEKSLTLATSNDQVLAQPVAFHNRQDPDVSGDITHPVYGTDCYNGAITGDVAATLGTPGSSVNASGTAVMQPVSYSTKLHNTTSNNAGKIFEERTTSLDANSPPPALLTAMQVRRLTPVECERLQGFPDNFTRIPWKKKPAEECPDGPRYKALGNSMAVPCMKWIGERINKQAHDNN